SRPVPTIRCTDTSGCRSTNQYATYRLKLKEFRVTQTKQRIDTPEQAAVPVTPEAASSENKSKSNGVSTAVNAIIHGPWDRLSGADKQYTKYKWLLNSKCHQSIESLTERVLRAAQSFCAEHL